MLVAGDPLWHGQRKSRQRDSSDLAGSPRRAWAMLRTRLGLVVLGLGGKL
jgi:hypothetical protein